MQYIVKISNTGYLGDGYISDIGDYGEWIHVPIIEKRESDAFKFDTEEEAYDVALDCGCNLDKIEVIKLIVNNL